MEKGTFLNRLFLRFPENREAYNYDLIEQTFLTTDKVAIQCLEHGVFYQKATAHYTGAGCPECGRIKSDNGRALTTEQYVQKSISKFGDKFCYLKTKYVRKEIDVVITCPVHGDFVTNPPQHLIFKHGCAKCDYEIPRQIKYRKLLEKAKKVHGDKYDYSKVIVGNASDKMEIGCPAHGYFWQSLYDHAEKGNGCASCSRASDRLSLSDFISKSRAVHGDKYDYSKVEYETNASMIRITCSKHGEFVQRASSHLAGCKCKKCFQEESRLTTEQFITNAKRIHGDTYDYSKVKYRDNKHKVEIVCSKHGSFWQKPNTHTSSGTGCQLCQESKGEKAVEVFLKKYGIVHIREYRIKPYLFRYDFYLPEFNIYIEFNGQQHYKPVEIFGGHEAFVKTQERDELKKQLVAKHGGSLIILTYLNLSDGTVEKTLISRLRKIYRVWCTANEKVLAFSSIVGVYRHFHVPDTVLTRELENEVRKVVKDFKMLFKSF